MDWVKQKMERARHQRKGYLEPPQLTPLRPRDERPLKTLKGRITRLIEISKSSSWFAGGTAVGAAIVFFAWWAGINSSGTPPTELVSHETLPSNEVAYTDTTTSRTVELDRQVDSLGGRVQELTDTISDLEAKLMRVRILAEAMPEPTGMTVSYTADNGQEVTTGGSSSAFDAMPPPASGTSKTPPAGDLLVKNTPQPVIEKPQNSKTRISAQQEAAMTKTPSKGPWVINLASLPNKADADRFTTHAKSKQVPVEQHQVTVKGKNYWRVQLTGFATASEARSHASEVKQALGLKDVWVTKR